MPKDDLNGGPGARRRTTLAPPIPKCAEVTNQAGGLQTQLSLVQAVPLEPISTDRAPQATGRSDPINSTADLNPLFIQIVVHWRPSSIIRRAFGTIREQHVDQFPTILALPERT